MCLPWKKKTQTHTSKNIRLPISPKNGFFIQLSNPVTSRFPSAFWKENKNNCNWRNIQKSLKMNLSQIFPKGKKIRTKEPRQSLATMKTSLECFLRQYTSDLLHATLRVGESTTRVPVRGAQRNNRNLISCASSNSIERISSHCLVQIGVIFNTLRCIQAVKILFPKTHGTHQ